jgi:hypothetical protein
MFATTKNRAPVSRGPILYGARRTSGRAAIVVHIVTAVAAIKSLRGTRSSSLLFGELFLRHFQHLRLTAVCLGKVRQVLRRFSVGCRPRHSLGLFCLPAQKLSFLRHRGPSAQLRPAPYSGFSALMWITQRGFRNSSVTSSRYRINKFRTASKVPRRPQSGGGGSAARPVRAAAHWTRDFAPARFERPTGPRAALPMSALLRITDSTQTSRHVSKVPTSDIPHADRLNKSRPWAALNSNSEYRGSGGHQSRLWLSTMGRTGGQ